jgi:hypothetical protein
VITENIKLKFMSVTKAKSEVDFASIEGDSKERWRRIIFFLLNIPCQNMSHGDEEHFKATYGSLLQFANYIEPRSRQSHSSIPLTAEGFEFILEDAPSQVHDILLHYIRKTNQRRNAMNTPSGQSSAR